jgi:hypothetical protein
MIAGMITGSSFAVHIGFMCGNITTKLGRCPIQDNPGKAGF